MILDLQRALDAERMATARRINPLRFVGIGVFWLLFFVLGELLHQPRWQSNFTLLSAYFTVSALLFYTSGRFGSVARWAGYALAFFDLPAICAVQASTLQTSTSPGAVAGFTIAINVVLVALSALSLDRYQVLATAAVATVLGIYLQFRAGISTGAMVSTVAVVGFAAAAANALIQRFINLTTRLLAQADERKALQSRLFLADRMAAIGTLAASVAHEVSNPLTYVLGNLEMLQNHLHASPDPSQEVMELVQGAYTGAERVVRMTRDLKGFARDDDPAPETVALRPVLEATLSVAQAEIRRRAQLVVDFQPVPDVTANESRLGQVFLNLLINAAQAIPPGNPHSHRVSIVLRCGDEAGQVLVAIADTGAGISSEHQRQLFQPFFTTKPKGEGTGLGLSISWEIVRSLGGTIRVQSEVGKGSTFEVVLPVGKLESPQT